MIEFKVEGLAELKKALDELPKELHRGPLRAAVSAGAKVVQDRAISLAPEDTGALKLAIYRTRSRSGSSAVQEMAIVGVKSKARGGVAKKAIRYWRFWEFGTSKMAAKPFMRPAFDTTIPQQIEALREKLASAIEKAAAKLRWRK